MKIRIVALLVVALSLVALADQPWLRSLYVADGSPEGVITGISGDLCSDKASAAVYVKSGGSGNTGWIKVVNSNGSPAIVLSGTTVQGAPKTGSVVLSSTGISIYLTGSTGLVITTGSTVATF